MSEWGYLSLSSAHGFTLEGKFWPTAEHYYHAKKFEGTTLEEKIRGAESVFIARNLAKERPQIFREDERMVRKNICSHGSEIRSDWKQVEGTIIEEALRAKFSQNHTLRKRLVTIDLKKCKSLYPNLYPAIEKIYLELTKVPPLPLPTNRDIRFSIVTEEDNQFIEQIMRILEDIRIVERQKQLFGEMMEDLILNLPEEAHKIVQDDPPSRTKEYISEIEKRLKVDHRLSILIGLFLRWIKVDLRPAQRKLVMDKLLSLNKKTIIFPPRFRAYRKVIKEEKKLWGRWGNYRFQRDDHLRLKGDIEPLRIELETLNIKIKGDQAHVPFYNQKVVEKMIFERSPEAGRDIWMTNKIDFLVDFADRLKLVRGDKKIECRDIDQAIEIIGFSKEKGPPSTLIKEHLKPYKKLFSKKAFKYFTTKGDLLAKDINYQGLTYEQSMEEFDKRHLWIFKLDKDLFSRALLNLQKISTPLWSLLTIFPADLRDSIETFVDKCGFSEATTLKLFNIHKKRLKERIIFLADCRGLENDLSDIERSAQYIQLFTPHGLTDEQYSRLLSFLEDQSPVNRKKWIEHFITLIMIDQREEIRKIIDS